MSKSIKKMIAVLIAIIIGCLGTVAFASEDSLFSMRDKNEKVTALHEKLTELGFYFMFCDIEYSTFTEIALKKLQNAMGWEETGKVKDEEELERILSLGPIVYPNLLVGYTEKILNNKYLLQDETLDGEGVLHLDYREGEKEYIDIIRWASLFEPKKETNYTLSFMAKGKGTIHSYFYPNAVLSGYSNMGNQTTSSDGHITTKLNEDWTFYTITWLTKEEIEEVKNILPARIFKGTEVWISKIKFEQGNHATEWILPEE